MLSGYMPPPSRSSTHAVNAQQMQHLSSLVDARARLQPPAPQHLVTTDQSQHNMFLEEPMLASVVGFQSAKHLSDKLQQELLQTTVDALLHQQRSTPQQEPSPLSVLVGSAFPSNVVATQVDASTTCTVPAASTHAMRNHMSDDAQ